MSNVGPPPGAKGAKLPKAHAAYVQRCPKVPWKIKVPVFMV